MNLATELGMVCEHLERCRAVEHEVHHKAQLSLYLFQMGIEAPFFAYPLPAGVRPDERPPVPHTGAR